MKAQQTVKRGKAPDAPATSHYVPFDAPDLGHGRARALCGSIVYDASHNHTPTCQACQQEQARIDRMEF